MAPCTSPCTSAAPFSTWHKVHGQAVHERGHEPWVPWWVAYQYGWALWTIGGHFRDPPDPGGQSVQSVQSVTALNDLYEHVTKDKHERMRERVATFNKPLADVLEPDDI